MHLRFYYICNLLKTQVDFYSNSFLFETVIHLCSFVQQLSHSRHIKHNMIHFQGPLSLASKVQKLYFNIVLYI